MRQFEYKSEKDIYDGVNSIQWDEHFLVDQTFRVGCTLKNAIFNHSQYISQVTKDAICDQFRDKFDRRPDVDLKKPDIRIQIHLDRNTA